MKINVKYIETQHIGDHDTAFSCLVNGCISQDVQAYITTEHACSSYGIPVCVTLDGRILTAHQLDGADLYKFGYNKLLNSVDIDAYLDEIMTARKHGYNIL